MAGRILIVDDDDLLRRSLAHNLERANFQVKSVATAEAALEVAYTEHPDLILMDITELKIDPGNVSGEYTDGTLTVNITVYSTSAGQFVDWTSNIGVDSVVVKGGPSANRYTYNPEATADTGLHAPANASKKFAGISHISFCYDPDEFQGCTIGYWGRPQHFDSWPAPYTTNTTLAEAGFIGAPNPNDTLLQAINDYQGGPTLNNKINLMLKQAAAALLNAAHPDVNYAFTVPQVLAAANSAIASGNQTVISDTQAAFDAANNNGCTLN